MEDFFSPLFCGFWLGGWKGGQKEGFREKVYRLPTWRDFNDVERFICYMLVVEVV